ncbi:NAD(P)/FAD-dependent oxidoreductase [Metabacillus sp. HB246100]
MSHIVLIGGGHAHLGILRSLRKKTIIHKVTLISPSSFQYYSGMFSGFTEGIYTEDDIRVNVQLLCQEANVQFIEDTIEQIDPQTKKVMGRKGSYSFDLVSFNIGSTSKAFDTNKIKPNFHFTKEISIFRASERPVIIGGGAAGIELALSTLAWRRRHNEENPVILISSTPILSTYGEKASKRITDVARKKGLLIYENQRVKEVASTYILTDKEEKIPYSHVLPLTGPTGHELFKSCSSSHDFLPVTSYLQHPTYPYIFGAGDCIEIEDDSTLPKNGVYAVRQGPVLWDNMNHYLENKPLNTFTPQKQFLSILSTGDKEGLLVYGTFSFHGRIAWKLKHYIDHKFMEKHRV